MTDGPAYLCTRASRLDRSPAPALARHQQQVLVLVHVALVEGLVVHEFGGALQRHAVRLGGGGSMTVLAQLLGDEAT
jgi:hypothetical protein